ncbi:MAG: hypothetical protein ABIH53_01920 [archaeon]
MKPTFFDIETQYLLNEVRENKSKLKIAVAGITCGDRTLLFEEPEVDQLIANLLNAELIVGHNILAFDYEVLRPYTTGEVIEKLKKKTVDMFDHLKNITGQWISLDDLGKRNVGHQKTLKSIDVPKMWRDGKKQEIREYLINDLKMTEAVYNHGKQTGSLKYEHKDYGKSLGEHNIKVSW